ncbi:hypothetical protein CO172_03030 [Candidatus Uhrbacteria bacterium CG_4_9_14_3_um_filter_36_7]|uniref:Uncharacterized protein n=1 Tax=Candidatus Uhrbacteria bacterium CG_4_9_14_3_um_filter_36_7 TaxID=1975033 RepID=A0A2M7XHF5_9BACT|nr:MAG: hypothetical protein CO172_03030 [Candidatus Uhrbacteria bacterium CG_4_9_14_3_um_filter_36_7]
MTTTQAKQLANLRENQTRAANLPLPPDAHGSTTPPPESRSRRERLFMDKQRIRQQQSNLAQQKWNTRQTDLKQRQQKTRSNMDLKLQAPKQRLQMALGKGKMSKKSQSPENEAVEKMRKEAKAAIRRALEHALNTILGALSVGTAGIGFILTAVPYVITLTDLNLQMIWGYYITKGKSVFFPALTWSPLPIPLPVVILHAGLVVIDLLIIFLIVVAVLITFIMVFAAQIMAGGAIAATYAYFTDPIFAQMVNQFLGSVF